MDRSETLAELLTIGARYARGEDVLADLSAFVARLQGGPQLALVSEPAEAPVEGHREAVQRIFDYWQRRAGKPKARLTPERASRVLARLRQGYSEAEIRAAIDGCLGSEFHQGQNDAGTVYDDLEMICRTGSRVERFSALAGGARPTPASTPAEQADERQRALRAQAERHLREGNAHEYNRILRALRTGKGS